MKEKTKVHIFENRVEFEPHTFYVGDNGIPHLEVIFHHNFDTNLVGKKLIVKYVFSDTRYIEEIKILNGNTIDFPIHYGCFQKGGWTNVYLSLENEQNRITFEPIIIKTKEPKAGTLYTDPAINKLAQDYVEELKKQININLEKKGKEFLNEKLDRRIKIMEIERIYDSVQFCTIKLPNPLHKYKHLEFEGCIFSNTFNTSTDYLVTFSSGKIYINVTDDEIQSFRNMLYQFGSPNLNQNKIGDFDENMKLLNLVSQSQQNNNHEIRLTSKFFINTGNVNAPWSIGLISGINGSIRMKLKIYGEEK